MGGGATRNKLRETDYAPVKPLGDPNRRRGHTRKIILLARAVAGKAVSGDGLDGADGHRTPAPRTLALRTLALALHKQEGVARNRRAVAGRRIPFAV